MLNTNILKTRNEFDDLSNNPIYANFRCHPKNSTIIIEFYTIKSTEQLKQNNSQYTKLSSENTHTS